MNDKQEIQMAIRFSKTFVKRLDRLAERMSKTGIRATPTEVLRLAAVLGVETLEVKNKQR